MDDDALVAEHWPHVVALTNALKALDGKTVKVKHQGHVRDEDDIDRIHRGLLKKQRQSGSLGLNK